MTPYTYGDSNWQDKLTSYDGSAVTYDEIGNATSIGDKLGQTADSLQNMKMKISGSNTFTM